MDTKKVLWAVTLVVIAVFLGWLLVFAILGYLNCCSRRPAPTPTSTSTPMPAFDPKSVEREIPFQQCVADCDKRYENCHNPAVKVREWKEMACDLLRTCQQKCLEAKYAK